MSHIEHVRPVTALWLQAHDVLGGPAHRWLPLPLSISGTERFRGTVRPFGLGIEVTYVVQPPWRKGDMALRHVVLTPAPKSLGTIECEIVLEATGSGPLKLIFRAETEPHGSRVARILGPPAARLLLRRFVTVVTARLEQAANARPERHP